MSAGSAFASGVRSGQAIWNSAVNNAMAGKRLDMLKTQFQFEQAQRKKSLDNELASESTYDKFTEYLAAASSSGEINFSTPEGREMYSDLKTSVEPNISRDPATWKRYESFSKERRSVIVCSRLKIIKQSAAKTTRFTRETKTTTLFLRQTEKRS
jgi:hypothetical protein